MAVLGAVLRSNDADLERWSRELGRCSVQFDSGSYAQSARSVCQDQPAQYLSSEYPNVSGLKSSHQSVPSSHPNNATETDPMSFAQKHRNLTVPRTSSLHAVKSDLNSAIARTIPKHRVTAKEIAASIDASEGTADNLRREVPDAMRG
jgi:hypothetical protein